MDLLADEHGSSLARGHDDLTRPRFQQASHECCQGRLASTGFPDENHGVPGRDVQAHLVQHVRTVLIAETQPLHVNRRRALVGVLDDGRFLVTGVDHTHYPLQAYPGSLQVVEEHQQEPYRGEQPQQHQDCRRRRTDAELVAGDE